ncbi:MAG: LPS export ABC transporter ATP-binding protein [Gammaproteobacteria bacterium]|nr:LPS export ABC transporter ATP-binding protein [Gammaproteobacteria bacterium]MBT8135150.1 LPS export ABC transporter ATP-binding protein [Gammaproteobacteria bacterium]NNJ49960.1 LPS export ABC transporter ATP-binding protein [Gammaproteobacteria bacterium]
MPTLIAKNLVKSYKSRTVVDDVSFQVNSGEVVGLLGPNGAGKTTSFYMVVGLVKADSGMIDLDDKDITRLPMHARAQHGLGYLPQEASVFRKLSVEENILAVLEAKKDLTEQQRKEKLDALIDDLQIDHIRQNTGMSLSGGERRRVEIARALASQPAFVLLDEPFAGVDPISVIEIQKIVKHLIERNIGVLITDHNVRETLGICDRAYILSGGKIIAKGQPEDILSNEEVREVYLGRDFRL